MEYQLLPVLVDLSDSRVVILAGDSTREDAVVQMLLLLSRCTAHLRLIAPAPSPRLMQAARDSDACVISRPYVREELHGADVVICMYEDSDVCDDVFAFCRTLGIRLCLTSQPGRSDFILREGSDND